MQQRYIFTFTPGDVVLAAVVGALLLLLMICTGILIGLQLYPGLSSAGPTIKTANESVQQHSTAKILQPALDSALMYELNSVRHTSAPEGRIHGKALYVIQLGVFFSRERAEYRRMELKQGGLTAYIIRAEKRSKDWYSVRAGLYDDMAIAKKAALGLSKKYRSAPTVLPAGE